MKIVDYIRKNDAEDELKEKLKDLEVEKPQVIPVVIGARRPAVISQGLKKK